ncbi:MAG: hypothetical protein WBD50_00880 [Candidatus Rhabdochlamydia sp.]
MIDNHFIYKDCFFTIEHTVSYDIPGYLILFFNQHVPLIYQGVEALSKLGPLLALSTQSIQEVIKPQKVYCLLFGEKNENPHFHLFPRTKELKQEYESLFGIRPDGVVSGPDLFSWITKSKQGVNAQAMAISRELQKALYSYSMNKEDC